MEAARNGRSMARAASTAGRSSRLVRASTAHVPSSAGHDRTSRVVRVGSSASSGARMSAPLVAALLRMTLANRSSLCSMSRTARSTTGAGQR